MSGLAWVERLALDGWRFWLEGDRLRYRAPAGADTPAVVADLKAMRDVLRARLLDEPDAFDLAPLSHGQRALWFLWLLAPDSAAYHQSLPLDLDEGAPAGAWRNAAAAVIARHATLRSRIIDRDGEPVQRIRAAAQVPWDETDARDWSPEALTAALQASHARPFDLAGAPPIRFHWFQHARGAVLLVTMHHVATDAWSFEILRRDLAEAAAAAAEGRAWAPPPLEVTYADYVRWQRALVDGADGERLWAYWARTMAEPRAVLDVPADHPRPARASLRGRAVVAEWSADVGEAVQAAARARGVTASTLLLAAFATLLHRWTGQADVVIGVPTTGRSRPEWAPIVGYFVSPVPVRIEVGDDDTFDAVVARAHDAVTGALAHADYPFPLIVERLRVERDASRSPVFDVTFNFLSRRAAGAGAGPRDVPLAQADGKFDLTLTVVEDAGLRCAFGYNQDLFEPSTVEALSVAFRALLTAAVAARGTTVATLPLGAAAVAPALEGRATDLTALVPIAAQVAAHAAASPEALAVVAPDGALTYAALEARADALARALTAAGVGAGDTVGLLVPRSTDFIAGVLAAWQAGAAYVPIDPAHPDDVRDAMLDAASARAVIGRDGVVARHMTAARPWTPTRDPLDAWAYVIFTSGSTGAPKGVAVDHRALANYVASVVEDLEIVRGARHGFVSALGADLGHTAIFPALATGGTVAIAGDEDVVDPARFDRFVRDRALDYLKVVPSHLAALVDGGATAVPRRAIVFGGESTPTAWATGLARRGGCRVWNHYGPTETTVGVMTSAIDVELPPPTPTLPLTRAVANTAIWLLDGTRTPVPRGMPGEVWVSGASLARGYVGDEARTRERFVEVPGLGRAYRTGDLARQMADGSILLAGRADRQVKVRGYRVEPGQVEAVLASHPAVRQAVVLPRRDGAVVTGLHAWVVAGGDAPKGDEGWQRWLAARLPAYMVPSRLVALDALPLTANGKVDTAALTRTADEAEGPASRGAAVRDVVELALARIWSEALERPAVGRDDDFFALGGHSLLAVRIASRIHDTWGVRLPLATLVTHRTVARLATAVYAALDGADTRLLVPLQPGTGDALVCFPGAGGSLLYFEPLVAALGPRVPVWGAQSPPGQALDDVETLAGLYAAAMLGEPGLAAPYRLAGHSFGALVAFETAARLTKAGAAVEVVHVIDQPAPGLEGVDDQTDPDERDWDRHIAIRIERLYGLDLEGGTLGLEAGLVRAGLVAADANAGYLAEYVARYRAHARAAARYRPEGRAAFAVTVCRAAERDAALGHVAGDDDPALGWTAWTTAPPGVVAIPGTHITMLTPPHVAALAAALGGDTPGR